MIEGLEDIDFEIKYHKVIVGFPELRYSHFYTVRGNSTEADKMISKLRDNELIQGEILSYLIVPEHNTVPLGVSQMPDKSFLNILNSLKEGQNQYRGIRDGFKSRERVFRYSRR